MITAFLSYQRDDGAWVARAVRQALQARDVDVFMDVENIDAGRFENIVLNEIEAREHFLVLLTRRTAQRLGRRDSWVAREINRALEVGSNVVPILIDDAKMEDVAPDFQSRTSLLELNAALLANNLFDQAIDVIVDRFLTQPRLQELRRLTAEEHFRSGQLAMQEGDWHAAEKNLDRAIYLRTRPDYLLARGVTRLQLGRELEALSDFDAAIVFDPFSVELMKAKFDLLQGLDRMREAIDLLPGWRHQATARASTLASRVIECSNRGDDLATAVHSIPELEFLHDPETVGHELVIQVVSTLAGHAPDEVRSRLIALLGSYTELHKL